MFTVGNVLAATFRIWARNLPRFLLIGLVCFAPVIAWYVLIRIDAIRELAQRYYYRPVWELHPALQNITGGDWIAGGLLYGAIAAVVVRLVRSERIGVFRGLGRAVRRGGSLFVGSLAEHIATSGVITVVIMLLWSRERWLWGGTGPYVWILWSAAWVVMHSLFCIVWPVAVIEGRGPLSTIARTFALARGNRFKVIAIVLVLWVLIAGLNYAMYELFFRTNDLDSYRRNMEIYGYVRFSVEILFSTLSATTLAVTYEQLREAKEGPTPDALDRVFG